MYIGKVLVVDEAWFLQDVVAAGTVSAGERLPADGHNSRPQRDADQPIIKMAHHAVFWHPVKCTRKERNLYHVANLKTISFKHSLKGRKTFKKKIGKESCLSVWAILSTWLKACDQENLGCVQSVSGGVGECQTLRG